MYVYIDIYSHMFMYDCFLVSQINVFNIIVFLDFIMPSKVYASIEAPLANNVCCCTSSRRCNLQIWL